MRVLVVEDERRLAAGLHAGLEQEGFTVDMAGDGTDGLWMAQEKGYDAIVLDVMLPGIGGLEVCEQLRAAGNWTPILVLTAMNGDSDQVDALDAGADDYLAKPFSFAVLQARLRALARRGVRERPTVLIVGDLSLDPASKRVLRGDREVPLTAREFAVLEFLMRNSDLTFSKQMILNHVWDYDYEGDSNIVEVYIRRLRSKLDRPGERSMIQTLRGIGYRLSHHDG